MTTDGTGAKDVRGALAFVKARADVDPHRIGALGLSTGADVLVDVAAANRDIAALVADGTAAAPTRTGAACAGPISAWCPAWSCSPPCGVLSGDAAGFARSRIQVVRVEVAVLLFSAGRCGGADFDVAYERAARGACGALEPDRTPRTRTRSARTAQSTSSAWAATRPGPQALTGSSRSSSRSRPASPTSRTSSGSPRRPRRRCAAPRSRRPALREPDHAAVVAEVVVAQLGVAVEAELADHGVLERAREEVGEEVRAGLLVERRAHLLVREHVVAVLAAQALERRASSSAP